jgi:hypothetical protein
VRTDGLRGVGWAFAVIGAFVALGMASACGLREEPEWITLDPGETMCFFQSDVATGVFGPCPDEPEPEGVAL